LADRVEQLRRGMLERGDHLYTSALTVGELLVKPMSETAREMEQRYLELFRGRAINVLPFDIASAPHYARIRRDRSINPPDAIQLACAAAAGIDLFLTNDE
jgi:predicted nucleic acid-binding protein